MPLSLPITCDFFIWLALHIPRKAAWAHLLRPSNLKRAEGEIRTRDLSLTKRLHYPCATTAYERLTRPSTIRTTRTTCTMMTRFCQHPISCRKSCTAMLTFKINHWFHTVNNSFMMPYLRIIFCQINFSYFSTYNRVHNKFLS